jgi:tetratricopeptide (TPR) repeat protein
LRLVVPNTDGASYDELVAQAQRAERAGHRDEARQLFHDAMRVLPANRASESSALLRWIGRTHQVDGDADKALECLDASLAVAEAHNDLGAIGHATNLKAIVHWHQGDLDEAEKLFHRARESAVSGGDVKLAAMTAQNLGNIGQVRGEHELALEHYETSLRDYRTLGLPHDVCVALNNLGLLHTSQQRWNAARAAYEEALQIAEVLGDVSTRIMIEVNYAEHFIAQGLFDRARGVADLASELARRANDRRAEGELH